MDVNAFLDGFALVVEPKNLLYCLVGVLIGMVIGVLPGLGPAATIAILLPITYTIDPVSAIIMLAGIYYGAQYGGTITSVLLRLPGEASSVVTVFDGFALAKQGKAGTALGIAAIGSFVGATISIIGLTLLSPGGGQHRAGLRAAGVRRAGAARACCWSPPSAAGNKLKALIAGADRAAAGHRRARQLHRGVAVHLRQPATRRRHRLRRRGDGPVRCRGDPLQPRTAPPQELEPPAKVGNVWPSRKDLKQSSGAIGRGSVIGFVLGVLPGGGAVLSSIVAYAMEKRRSKTPERFGRGAVEGRRGAGDRQQRGGHVVVHPAADDRSTRQRHDGDAVRRAADPRRLTRTATGHEHPDVFWGVINSMYIGNILLLILSMPLVGLFVRILRVRPAILAPITALITILGVYTINNSIVRHLLDGRVRRHRLPDEEGRLRPRPDGAGVRPRHRSSSRAPAGRC